MTYIATAEGWLYLAGVMDLHGRKLVGWWAMDSRIKTELVCAALKQAIGQTGALRDSSYILDRGVQCASKCYQKWCLSSYGRQ